MPDDEFQRIARIKQRFASASQDVSLGIGDDAALLRALHGQIALSVDASVENVHFCRDFARLDVIGERAFSAAISDLAAMAAVPKAALIALGLPRELQDYELDELILGIARGAERYAAPVVGGNLSQASELSITTTVVGEVQGRALTRSGARPGDRIFVTGTLGSAALGLCLLKAGVSARGPSFVERWQNPSARIQAGLALSELASAAIDVSDGALQDLTHICEASAVGAEIRASALPLDPGYCELARAMGLDPLALALAGGEDYELLYTVPANAKACGPGTCIGEITERTGEVVVLDAAGTPMAAPLHGYRHFAG